MSQPPYNGPQQGQPNPPAGYGNQGNYPQGAPGGVPAGYSGQGNFQQGPPQQGYSSYAGGSGGGAPGLFSGDFSRSAIPQTAKIAHLAVLILAIVFAAAGLIEAILYFTSSYGGSQAVLTGIIALVKGPALGFAVLALGRLFIDFVVRSTSKS